jgi:hypothetical protein
MALWPFLVAFVALVSRICAERCLPLAGHCRRFLLEVWTHLPQS